MEFVAKQIDNHQFIYFFLNGMKNLENKSKDLCHLIIDDNDGIYSDYGHFRYIGKFERQHRNAVIIHSQVSLSLSMSIVHQKKMLKIVTPPNSVAHHRPEREWQFSMEDGDQVELIGRRAVVMSA